jgi:uncharacterized protein (DUF1684 family)
MTTALMMTALLAAAPMDAESHLAEVEDWHARRLAALTRPHGWLSLVGLHWLEGARWTLGRGEGNDIVLATGPAHLGVLERDAEGRHVLTLAAAEGHIGEPGTRRAALDAGAEVLFGEAKLVLLARGERRALRVWDAEAPTRTGFAGIERFPVSLDWRIDAEWEAYEPPRALEVVDVTGAVVSMRSPGRAWFTIDGRRHGLDAVQEAGETQLWFIFGDRTNGRETYGGGRFLYTPLPDAAARVVLDFNQAYNPPCAFTPFSTCPLPPPENRLDLRVTAGEMRYRPVP